VKPLLAPSHLPTLRADLQAVYRDRRHDLFAFAYRLTGSERSAEDIVHESVVRVLDGRCRLDARRGDLVLLLFGVVRNVAREYRRRAAREGQTPLPDEAIVTAQPDHVIAVRTALSALSETDREIIILSAYHGYQPREIARALGSSSVVVRVRLHRARARLKDLLLYGRDRLEDAPRLGVRS